MKIVSSRGALHSSEYHKKRLKRRKAFKIAIVFGIVILLTGLVLATRHKSIQINKIVIADSVVGRVDATKIVTQMLDESYLWVIPKTNAFLYPKSDLEHVLMSKFPRFKSVELDVEDINTLNIVVVEREPTALYCDEKCYFLDERGYIYADAPAYSDAPYFVYTSDRAIESPIGKLVLEDQFTKVNGFIDSTKSLSIVFTTLEVGDDEYRLVLPSGGKIIWKKNADFEATLVNLKAFLEEPSIKSQTGFLDKILYIDLRVENKVFYKFKE